jgi:PAS domain S-box-containing protein
MNAVLDRLFGSACVGPECSGTNGLLARLIPAADGGIALGLLAILAALLWLVHRRADIFRQYRALVLSAGGLLLLLAAAHIADAIGAGEPRILTTMAKAAVAVVGAITAMLLWRHLSRPAGAPAPGHSASEAPPPSATAPHEATLRELETVRRDLESRVEERTRELSLVTARLETALRCASVHAFSQDNELRYIWVYDPDAAVAAEMVGRTDFEVLPADARDTVIAIKRRVLETGQPETCEVCSVNPRERALYSLHLEPTIGSEGRVDGLTGAAVDISRMRSLETEQRRLADELRTALHHYEIALRGSHVTLFTQDRNLRFTSVSNPLFGREPGDVVGHADTDILPPEGREPFAALARAALAGGRGQSGEISVKEAGKTRWYELHVEPLPGPNGRIIGVTCALFDITERKTNEGHLRLLMRELTHRSKNLLAVIQSMARQTARHAGSIDDFLDTFGDRLQAIATSHDLLVQEGWYGASLHDLTHRQLAKYLDGAADRVSLSGPAVHLKPAAAQSFGLALHELAMNAERFGALSVPQGRVEINWRRLRPSSGTGEEGVEITWTEHNGPDVSAPTSRGFGSLVVEKNLSRALDAEVALTFEPTGVRCRMVIPASHLLAAR